MRLRSDSISSCMSMYSSGISPDPKKKIKAGLMEEENDMLNEDKTDIKEFYTFHEDVIRIALKICRRSLQELDDVIDNPDIAENMCKVTFDEWQYLQKVNLDKPEQNLDPMVSKKDQLKQIQTPRYIVQNSM